MSVRGRELLDEVHRNGVPWFLGDRELLKESIGFMTRGFGTCATSARLAIVENKRSEIGPGIFSANKREGLILPEMTRKNVVMFVPEYSEPKVLSFWDVDSFVVEQESLTANCPPGIYGVPGDL